MQQRSKRATKTLIGRLPLWARERRLFDFWLWVAVEHPWVADCWWRLGTNSWNESTKILLTIAGDSMPFFWAGWSRWRQRDWCWSWGSSQLFFWCRNSWHWCYSPHILLNQPEQIDSVQLANPSNSFVGDLDCWHVFKLIAVLHAVMTDVTSNPHDEIHSCLEYLRVPLHFLFLGEVSCTPACPQTLQQALKNSRPISSLITIHLHHLKELTGKTVKLRLQFKVQTRQETRLLKQGGKEWSMIRIA